LKKTLYSKTQVVLKGTVSRFSEKMLRVPISVINLPPNTRAETFPNEVDVLIKASLAELKQLKKSDIKVIGDFATVRNTNSRKMLLRIVKQPVAIHEAELVRKQVDFIVKHE